MQDELLYHYCSLETFLSIIKNKTLRLSNITKSNDYKEMIYVLSDCEELICDIIKEKYNEYQDMERYSYLNQIKTCIEEKVLNLSRRTIIAHAMCFSKCGDKLSQWRGYANDGCGISIGFDPNTLDKYLKKEKYITISDVDYSDNNTDFITQNVTNIIKDMNKKETYKTASIDGIIRTISNELVHRVFLHKAIVYKNPAFDEEQEVRIHTYIPQSEFGSLTCPRVDEFIPKLEAEIAPLTAEYNFFVRKDKIVSYFDICFDHHPTEDTTIVHEFIKSIVIGPKANISAEEIKHILLTYKLGGCTSITKSKASYR